MSRFTLYPTLQSAYRKGHSIKKALLKIQNDILMNLNCKHVTLLVLLDLSAASTQSTTISCLFVLSQVSALMTLPWTGLSLILTTGALTIWMEFSVIPGRIQMERFIPVESFRKKGNTFRGISIFPLLPEFPKISVPFVHSYSARLLTVILLRKNAKDLKDGSHFQNVYRYNVCLCSSLVLADF